MEKGFFCLKPSSLYLPPAALRKPCPSVPNITEWLPDKLTPRRIIITEGLLPRKPEA